MSTRRRLEPLVRQDCALRHSTSLSLTATARDLTSPRWMTHIKTPTLHVIYVDVQDWILISSLPRTSISLLTLACLDGRIARDCTLQLLRASSAPICVPRSKQIADATAATLMSWHDLGTHRPLHRLLLQRPLPNRRQVPQRICRLLHQQWFQHRTRPQVHQQRPLSKNA